MSESAALETQVIEPPSEVDTDSFYSFRDLMKEPDSKEEWLIEGLFKARSINHLIGQTSSGKSVIALQICRSIREGTDFLGFKPGKKGTILFFGLEDGKSRIKDRTKKQKWKTAEDLPEVFFHHELLLTNKGGYKKLEAAIEKFNPILVVIDPLLMVIGSKSINLNDNIHMAEFARKMREYVRKHNLAFLIVHHSKKLPYNIEDTGELDSGIGATANLGLSDTRLMFFGKADEKKIRIFGKDVAPQLVSIKQDSLNYAWVKKRRYRKGGE